MKIIQEMEDELTLLFTQPPEITEFCNKTNDIIRNANVPFEWYTKRKLQEMEILIKRPDIPDVFVNELDNYSKLNDGSEYFRIYVKNTNEQIAIPIINENWASILDLLNSNYVIEELVDKDQKQIVAMKLGHNKVTVSIIKRELKEYIESLNVLDVKITTRYVADKVDDVYAYEIFANYQVNNTKQRRKFIRDFANHLEAKGLRREARNVLIDRFYYLRDEYDYFVGINKQDDVRLFVSITKKTSNLSLAYPYLNITDLSDKQKSSNCVYLIRLGAYVKLKENVYKIGQTSNFMKRLKNSDYHSGYNKDVEIYGVWPCDNCKTAESNIIDSFNKKFIRRRDLGNEYYQCDNVLEMVRSIEEIVVDMAIESLLGDNTSDEDYFW